MANKAKQSQKKTAGVGGRVRPLTKKQLKEKSKKEAAKQPPIPGSFKLLQEVIALLKQNWKVLSGIVLVYLLLNIIFAGGVLGNLNNAISNARTSHHFSDALGGYGSLLSLGSTSSSSQTGSSAAQSLLLVFESLVIIWSLRQLLARQTIGVKQAYYQSMTPLVPFLLVIFFILLQLLPITVGAALLALVLSSVITGGGLVAAVFIIIFAAFAAWSIYMLSGSIFALYIVTLPDMHPRQALRSAKSLVRYRRWPILRRLLFLPLFIFLGLGLITIPLILLVPFVVGLVFLILLMISLLFAHAYLYNLYRGLIE